VIEGTNHLSNAVVGLFDPGTPAPIAGSWMDNWGTGHHINTAMWEDAWDNQFWITEWAGTADDGFLIARNSDLNGWNPGLWSRFDWTWDGSDTYYCQTVFDGATRMDALSATPSDPMRLSDGCGGFSWTRLDHDAIALEGAWDDQWGASHEIADELWLDSYGNTFHIADYSNLDSYAIAQNDAANYWNPSLWSRFDWTLSGGAVWYCQTAFAASTEAAARGTAPADATDPATGGCGGFSWTRMLP
jgi:hypothetical protein